MGNIGAGITLPANKYVKIAMSGHFMPIVTNTESNIRVSSTWQNRSVKETIDIFGITLNIILLGKASETKKK